MKLRRDLKRINDNPVGVSFALIGRLVDDIMNTTFDNIFSIAASIYVEKLLKGIKNVPLSALNVDKFDIGDIILTKPYDQEKLNDEKIITKLINSVLNENNIRKQIKQYSILQYFVDPNAVDTNNNSNHYRIIDYESVGNANDICYDMDEMAMAELIKYGARVNEKEKSGNTALSLAVFLQNENIIEMLLKSGASVVYTNNGSNRNIYEFCFIQLLNCINSSPALNLKDNEERVKDHLMEKLDGKILPRNHHIILRMAIYMFDHQLTCITGTYPNMWDRDNYKKILGIVQLKDARMDLLPISKIDNEVVTQSIVGYLSYNETLENYRNDLMKEREYYIRLNNSIKNMTIELAELNTDPTKNKNRIEELKTMIADIKTEFAKTDTKIKEMMKSIKKLNKLDFRKDDNVTKMVNAIKHFNKTDKNVCKIYEMFFESINQKNISSKEYMTYTLIWQQLLFRPEKELRTDHTQLTTNVQKYIIEQQIVESDIFADGYKPIVKFYNDVLVKYGRDYLELSIYLNDDPQNYALNQIFCIIEHVFSHTMSIDYINMITHIIARQDKGTKDDEVIRRTYNILLTSDFIKYCIEIMPKYIIKVVTKISEGERDTDQNTSVLDILSKSIEKLPTNKFDALSKKSMDQIKEMIIPFFADYMSTYTAEMHNIIVKYIKSLIVQGRILNILKMLADKANKEKEIM